MDKFKMFFDKPLLNTFFVLIIVLAIIKACLAIPAGKSVGLRKPDIYLLGYQKIYPSKVIPAEEQFRSKKDFKNDFVSKTKNDYFISTMTKTVVFTCEAGYPIKWKFPVPMQIVPALHRDLKLYDFRVSNMSQDDPSPVNNRFKLTIGLMFSAAKFLSVNVTCISAENHTEIQSSSIHVFYANSSGLEHQGKTLNITLGPTKISDFQSLVLPCRPSSPNLQIVLEKAAMVTTSNHTNGRSEARTYWKWVHNDSDITYDPKHGFTLMRGHLGNQTTGLYRCSAINIASDGKESLDKQQFVLVNVTSSPSDTKAQIASFVPIAIFNGTANVTKEISMYSHHMHTYPGPIIQCCSGLKNKPPKLYSNPCQNPMECELYKTVMMEQIGGEIGYTYYDDLLYFFDPLPQKYNPSDCSKTVLVGPSTLVVCQGDTMDYVEQFMQVFKQESSGPVANGSERLRTADPIDRLRQERTPSLSIFNTESSLDSKTIAERMAILVGRPMQKWEKHQVKSRPMYFIEMRDPLLKTAEPGRTPRIIQKEINAMRSAPSIIEYERNAYYESDSIILMCFGVQFFYAKGPRIRLNWKNGTKTDLENVTISGSKVMDRKNLYLAENTVMFGGWGDEIISTFGTQVVASQEMNSVDCWMPVRNSGKWDKMSKSLQVLPTVPPRFAEKLEENVTLSEGDTCHVITCTIVEGAPFPMFAVYENEFEKYTALNTGKVQLDKDTNLIKARIHIQRVRKSDQRVWRCIAENSKGRVTRTINVLVKASDQSVSKNIVEVDLQ